jgi:hypothetical protein
MMPFGAASVVLAETFCENQACSSHSKVYMNVLYAYYL